MRTLTNVPAGRAGAVYDVVVTAAFATPWTAGLALGAISTVHDRLSLAGDPMPSFATTHLLYVTLFGVVVTMWGVVRVLWPVPLLIAADTVGRAAFSLIFVWGLLNGLSSVAVAFLVMELFWLLLQARGVHTALKTSASQQVLAA